MPCAWIRSNPAAFISARPAARSTAPPTAATTGKQSCMTFHRFIQWKCKTSNESSKFQAPSSNEIPNSKHHSGCSMFGAWNFASMRVMLPYHLRKLAHVDGELELEV